MTPLVIGFGNPLRGDDGAGWHAAGLIAADRRAEGVTVLRRHQLTPELAEDVSAADLVVFVDAAGPGAAPGSVVATAVEPDRGRVGRAAPAFSHHLDPEGLVALAEALYGHAPPATLVRVGAADMEPGTELSAAVAGAMRRVVGAVVAVIGPHPGAGRRA